MTAGRHARAGVARAATTMAVGTGLSRLAGLVRLLALVYAVKAGVLADAYNLANTMPNIVVDLVLGGVVSATFVPVFVERLAARSRSEATEAISAVVSVTLLVTAAASVAFLVASPFIIDAMTALYRGGHGAAERRVATELLLLFVPQLTCYGVIAVVTALLNARREFAAPMFAPIANNLVLVVVLVIFGATVRSATLAHVDPSRGQLLLLGLGTTAGVVVQAAMLLPALRRLDLRLRWTPDFRHEAVRRIVGLSGWTVGLVVTNQIALLVVLAMSQRVGTGAVSAYTYAYTFFQLPYGVVAVSIMTATTPELAEHWTRGDLPAFRRRLATGLRSMLAIIVPAAAGMVVLARPGLQLLGRLLAHPGATGETGQSLAMLALGLPGFCVFIYVVRALQAVQDLRRAFRLYVLENGVNVVLAVALAGPLGVRGIALSISVAYTVAAVAALVDLRGRVGGLELGAVGRAVGRVAVASVGLAVAAAAGVSISASTSTGGLAGRVAVGVTAGLAGFVLCALAMTAVLHRAAAPPDTPAAPRRPGRPERPGPPRPGPLPPAGRPPLRPGPLGPTRRPDRS